jgi:two-component system repressor protein LuxO
MTVFSERLLASEKTDADAVSISRAAGPERRNELVLLESKSLEAAQYAAALERAGFTVTVVTSAAGLPELVESCRPDLVIIDLTVDNTDAFRLVAAIHALEPPVAIVATTTDPSLNTAIKAVRAGARDCLSKPFRPERLVVAVQNALGSGSWAERSEPRPAPAAARRPDGFIGVSPQMQGIYRIINIAAKSKAAVFITGESGTGKEVCAQAIHRASARQNKPFIAINCSAMPRDLVESELFGHVKGAFTGAVSSRAGAALQANHGTLFLDEICEMDVGLQAKLLRFLQTGIVQRVGSSAVEQVDVRLICATNRDPLAEIAAGRFREDLYYRLYVLPIQLPPLRERGADILEIARTLLAEITAEEGRYPKRLAPCAEAAIARYSWPGNVRQLQNVLRSVVLLNHEEVVTADALPEPVRAAEARPVIRRQPLGTGQVRPELGWTAGPAPSNGAASNQVGVVEPLWVVEKRVIEEAISVCADNIARAAAALEISPSTIYRKRQVWAAGGGMLHMGTQVDT